MITTGRCSKDTVLAARSLLERVTGIEPALSAWEADVLPLNYTRAPALSRWGTGMYCVRPDIVPDPIGCQGAPLRS